MGLLAVIGPSRNDQRCRDRSLRRTYLPTIPCACHQARTSRSSAGKSIFEGTGLNVGMNALQEYENRPPIWDGRDHPRYYPASEPLTRKICSGSALNSDGDQHTLGPFPPSK